MITDQNKWNVIEAYLAGQLDEAGRQEVAQKMSDDAQFRSDVLMQHMLNKHLEQEQKEADNALVDQFLVDNPLPKTPAEPVARQVSLWRQPWLRAAALIALIGLCWLGYTRWSKPTVIATQITYEQRDFGVSGTHGSGQLTTFPVEFWLIDVTPNEYSSGTDGLHIYLPNQPIDTAQWRLHDDPKTGGFLLSTPQGQIYHLERDTYNQRKPLQK